jgi:hypothetical protein
MNQQAYEDLAGLYSDLFKEKYGVRDRTHMSNYSYDYLEREIARLEQIPSRDDAWYDDRQAEVLADEAETRDLMGSPDDLEHLSKTSGMSRRFESTQKRRTMKITKRQLRRLIKEAIADINTNSSSRTVRMDYFGGDDVFDSAQDAYETAVQVLQPEVEVMDVYVSPIAGWGIEVEAESFEDYKRAWDNWIRHYHGGAQSIPAETEDDMAHLVDEWNSGYGQTDHGYPGDPGVPDQDEMYSKWRAGH